MRLFVAVFVIVSLLGVCDKTCLAQAVRDMEKMSQNYIGFGNDIKSYKIIYDPANEKDYITYSNLIREKIKEGLKDIYSDYGREGDVCLLFVLNSNGSLYAFDIDPNSIEDKKLRDIAGLGLRKAAPFPSFPEILPYDRMLFSIVISFKKDD